MNTAGTSGTHDTEAFNAGNTAGEASADKMKDTGKIDSTETPAAGEEMGLPKNERQPEVEKETVYIEVLTQEPGSQGRPTDFSYFAEEIPPTSGFRWWYAPIIAAPVVLAAGTTVAAVLLVQRRRRRRELEVAAATKTWLDTLRMRRTQHRRELRAAELAAAAAATKTWLDTLRIRRARTQESDLVQPGVKRSRNTIQFVPGQIGAWRDQVPAQIGTWRALATDRATRLRKLALSNAQSYADAARAQALATRDSAYQAVNNAGDQISGTASHTLAFGLGALVSAVATYVLRWRQRMIEADSEYSATTGANRMREEPIL
jgi:hypothetical protein